MSSLLFSKIHWIHCTADGTALHQLPRVRFQNEYIMRDLLEN